MSNEHAVNLGSFVYGDTGSDITLTIEDEDGEAVELGGSTSISLECRTVQGETVSIPGTATAPSDGEMSFEDLGTCVTPEASRPRIALEGRIKWTQGGEQHWSRDAVRFEVVLFP